MADFSAFIDNKIVEAITGRTAFGALSCYIGLLTTQPTLPGSGSGVCGAVETSYTGYGGRVQLTSSNMGAASAGSNTNSSTISFGNCTAGSASITGWGVYDAASAGNLLYAKASALSVSAGINPQLAAGALTVTEA